MKKSPAGERNISEKLQSSCHHLKITPCVIEGVLLVFFFTSDRQMINDKAGGVGDGAGRNRRKREENRQTKSTGL